MHFTALHYIAFQVQVMYMHIVVSVHVLVNLLLTVNKLKRYLLK